MYQVERYNENPIDLGLISSTFEAAYKRKFSKNYWRWRFEENPVTEKIYINYIKSNNKIAAYYAVSPCKIVIDKQEFPIALSNMTMTHPEFQGKGLFSVLAEEMISTLREDGFIGIYGFANKNSHYGFRKRLGWKDLGILNQMQLSTDSVKRNLKFSDCSIYTTVLNKDIVTMCTALRHSDSRVHILREYEVLLWRLIDNPDNSYKATICSIDNEIRSIFITKEYDNQLDVMEIFNRTVLKEDVLSVFIGSVKKKYKTINIWSNLFSDEHLLLEKFGFEEKAFNTYFGYIPIQGIDHSNAMSSIANWHYRFIDSDIY